MNGNDGRHSSVEGKVVVYLQSSEDVQMIHEALEEAGVASVVCVAPDHFISVLQTGAGAAIVGTEMLTPAVVPLLRDILEKQPSWSYLPLFILLTDDTDNSPDCDCFIGDVEYIARPTQARTLVPRIGAALRRRQRQYKVRDEVLALKYSENRYRTLFNSIVEGFCIIRMIFDDSGKPIDYLFLETNAAFERYTGLHARGETLRDLAPMHEEQWLEAYGRVALTGEPARFVSHASQLDRWFEVYAFRHGPPEKGELAVLFSDITERKTAEDAARSSEGRFAKIFNFAPALIGITTLEEGRIIDVNDNALQFLGYARAEVLGRTTQEIGLWGDEQDRARIIRAVEEHAGSIRNLEITYRGKSGAVFTGLYSAEIIDFDHNRYLLSMVQDITDLKGAQEEIERLNRDLESQVAELKEANTELEAFNRMVSHDLRQPLNRMGLLIQAVEMLCGEALSEECKDHVRGIYQRTLAMNDLITSLLNFSNSTRVELRRELIDITDMAKDVAAEVTFNAPGRGITFRAAEGMVTHADRGLIRAVLQNLIGNAWKYTSMRVDAVIEVGVTEFEGRETFYVRDNGMGFDMAQAGELFAPFKRLPGVEEYIGFGIGLATVERIIRRHGGCVWAESEPDRGATFYFTLP
ncbi:PAS domain S-box protein [Geomonas sp. RF6]|uniref:PAS domain S-box protein n=1 Tax=Geomonas sp. RF6 TaxID=2897342 RepID=UPI001E5AD21F|nr:PAS domain S-box protein [Geomonas sp. RF6]UFS72674.1 PAS domain S-box protein [Geomonas sp. RF6]